MDDRDTFIEMCEKAEQVQAVWKPKEGDCALYHHDICPSLDDPAHGAYFEDVVGIMGIDIHMSVNRDELTWLPLPHQSLEMVDLGGDPKWWPRLNGLQRFAEKTWPKKVGHPYRTFDQLCLAFLMYRRFNRLWSGERHQWEIGG